MRKGVRDKMKNFIEVKDEFIRKCYDHEVLLSFNNDEDARNLKEWWYEIGFESFIYWLENKLDDLNSLED